MEWQDQGILVATRRHGEGSAIIEVFTAKHGRQAGVVRGGGSRKTLPLLQPGAQIEATWKARLPEHLGTFTVKHDFSRIGGLLQSRARLGAFNAWLSLVLGFLPEREVFEGLYSTGIAHLSRLVDGGEWRASHAIWELDLLTALGYGLDLTRCVVTGKTDDLSYVSPKSGCAVSTEAAQGWEDKLLKLPAFILDRDIGEISDASFYHALRLTGHFLEARALPDRPGQTKIPEARARMLSGIRKNLRLNSIE